VLVLVLASAAFVYAAAIATVTALILEQRAAGLEHRKQRDDPYATGLKTSIDRINPNVLPALVALLLAACSLPVVALTLGATPGDAVVPTDRLGSFDPARWAAAAGAVLLSALVAGATCASTVKRHAKAGAWLTFLVALLVAIPALPLMPAILGQSVGAGFVCVGACSDMTSTTNLGHGLVSDLAFPLAPLLEPVPVVTLAVGVVIWTRLVRRCL
jgi:hypothetical protein